MKIECNKIHPASIMNKKRKLLENRMNGGEVDIDETNIEGNRSLYIGSIGLMIGQIGAIIYWFIKS